MKLRLGMVVDAGICGNVVLRDIAGSHSHREFVSWGQAGIGWNKSMASLMSYEALVHGYWWL